LVDWAPFVPATAAADDGAPDAAAWLRRGEPFLRLEGGIVGRLDDMVSIRGNNVYPSALENLLRRFDDTVLEYRAEILEGRDGARLRLTLECDERAADAAAQERLRSRVVEAVREQLYFRPEVVLVRAGTLPRSEFKAQRFVRVPLAT
jgi:phenylacetate-CoA ligase